MMRRYRSVFILLLITLLSGGLYFYLEFFGKPAGEGDLFSFGRNEEIQEIRIQNDYGLFEFYKDGQGDWMVRADGELKGDFQTSHEKMRLMTEALESFHYSRLLSKEDVRYGLEKPLSQVSFTTTKGQTGKLAIGQKAPSGADSYVKEEKSGRIYVVPEQSIAQMTGSIAAYRSKDVLSIDKRTLQKIEYYDNHEKIISAELTGNTWNMSYPWQVPARVVEMEEIKDMIGTWTIAGYPAVKKADYQSIGLKDPGRFLVLTDGSGAEQSIYFGKSDGTYTYARNGNEDDIIMLYTSDIDLERITPEHIFFVAPLKAAVNDIEKIQMVINGNSYEFRISGAGETVYCNGRIIEPDNFMTIYYKYILILACGGEKEPVVLNGTPVMEFTSYYRSGLQTTVALYERDETTYYMGINGTIQFFLEKSKVKNLTDRIDGYVD